MSASVWKSAVLFEGPGFGDQGDVARSLGFAGLKAQRVSAGGGSRRLGPGDLPDVSSADFFVLRAPWSATPEEILYSTLLAERLKDVLPLSGGSASLLGVGRGALVLLAAILGDLSKLDWTSAFEDSSKWIDVSANGGGRSLSLKAFVHGRAVFNVEHPRLEPWITHETAGTVGWKIDGRIWISLVDILSYSERAQLPEFGYADLTQVPTQAQVIERFARRAW
jgi:hypothetical protein